jgi:hypothetical protein
MGGLIAKSILSLYRFIAVSPISNLTAFAEKVQARHEGAKDAKVRMIPLQTALGFGYACRKGAKSGLVAIATAGRNLS